MQLIQNILNLKDKIKFKAPIFHSQCIDHQSFDLELYDDLTRTSPVLEHSLHEGEEKLKTFPDLSKDIFMSLFKYNPELRQEKDMLPSRKYNYNMMKEFMETEEFEKLRDLCKLNLINSAMGTEILHNKALEKINKVIEEREKKKKNNGNNPTSLDSIQIMNQMVAQEQIAQRETEKQLKAQEQQQAQEQKQDSQQNAKQPQNQNGQPQESPQSNQESNPIPMPSMSNAEDIPSQDSQSDIVSDFNSDDLGQGSGESDSDLDGVRMTEEAARKLAEMQEQMSNSNEMQDMKREMKQALQKAAEQAQEDVREIDNFINSWGFGGDDNPNRVSFEETRSALERLRNSEELKKLTDIIGRFRTIAKNKLRKRSKGEGLDIKDVTVGDNIKRTLPSELGLLSNSRTKRQFYKKYAEKQLLQYEVEHKKRKGMGPMIVCLDISGSMKGNKLKWGKAVALALLEISQRQKRNYALLPFENRVVHEHLIPKGTLKPDEVLDIAEIGCCGGTSFSAPVRRAMEIIEKEKDFRKGDIVFITDGDCSMYGKQEQDFLKMKKEKNIVVQTIIINMGGRCSDAGVKNWSDEIRKISKLADLSEDLASDIFNVSAKTDN